MITYSQQIKSAHMRLTKLDAPVPLLAHPLQSGATFLPWGELAAEADQLDAAVGWV